MKYFLLKQMLLIKVIPFNYFVISMMPKVLPSVSLHPAMYPTEGIAVLDSNICPPSSFTLIIDLSKEST